MKNNSDMLKRMVEKQNKEIGMIRSNKRDNANNYGRVASDDVRECPDGKDSNTSCNIDAEMVDNSVKEYNESGVVGNPVHTSTSHTNNPTIGTAGNGGDNASRTAPSSTGQKTKINLKVTKEYKIAVSPSSKAVLQAMLKFRTAQYDVKSNAWHIGLSDYSAAIKELRKIFVFDRIPNDSIRILNKYSMKREYEDFVDREVARTCVFNGSGPVKRDITGTSSDEMVNNGEMSSKKSLNACSTAVSSGAVFPTATTSNKFSFVHLKTYLLPFQKQSVNKAISNGGRIILADSMGLGKTIQALSIALYYSLEWPLLIVAPASLLDNWRDEIEKFCGVKVCVVRDIGDIGNGSVFVVSYDFLSKNVAHFENMVVRNDRGEKNEERNADNSTANPATVADTSNAGVAISDTTAATKTFSERARTNDPTATSNTLRGTQKVSGTLTTTSRINVIIVDECHYLKNMQSKRTRTLLPFIKKMNRVVLVSGTPALSRPIELYPLIYVLEGFNYNDYANRYCMDGRSRFNRFMRHKGCSNYDELSLVIGGMMVRRTKEDVMSDLPRKYREHVLLECTGSTAGSGVSSTNNAGAGTGSTSANITSIDDVDHTIMALYAQAAEIKLSSVITYIHNYIHKHIKGTANKLVIFCHHKCMITGIINSLDVGHIKIDGSVSSTIRQRLVNSFQLDDSIKVAVLSITSANTGLNLTAASTVIFSELYWNPGNLLQAEDRVHRIGQRRDVRVYFLLGKGTVDEMVWPKIVGKLGVLERLGVGENVLKSVGERKGGSILSAFERIKGDKGA
ncbi:hypothetical protein VCUG_02434 [Vavraia culicis subsp. floridensis]|uniref:Uncharacterized protein n=1 Tax=Vavraia culicis (isolate floridensis) TaxID=948595 RepID=L2GRR7_VAVCU|nr:uncharacterized protein VCUG_02434 [Vavraia culicis subsp. floridensis]ELA46072.1 hypothetical protein VCUG_02434 [Vavraia culicis subsp. floridensis]